MDVVMEYIILNICYATYLYWTVVDMWLVYGSLVEVVLILLFLSPFPLNQKKLVHAEDPFNDEHKERQEVEMLAKKFEMKYVSIVFT